MKSIFLVAISILLSINSFSQTASTPNVVGENFTIYSEVLKEDRNIQVSLPANYSETDEKYPVLYILDGQRFFLHGVSLHQSFIEFDQTPEFIIVGITIDESKRMHTFSSNAENFSHFLEREVISFINEKFRTTNERVLFGWAYAGGFGIEILISNPQLFNSYIVASPYPVSSKISRIDSLFTNHNEMDNLLYFSSDIQEYGVKEGTYELKQLLEKKAPATMRWTFKELVGEIHRSTPYSTLFHGILDHFQFYTQVPIRNLDHFNELGGMEYVYDYYKKRSERYGLSTEMSPFTKYNLTRGAIRANDFNQFEAFVSEFGDHELVRQLRVNWACTIAEFYLENKEYQKAKDMLLFISSLHPEEARPFKGIGDAYKALSDPAKAKQYYLKSQEIEGKE